MIALSRFVPVHARQLSTTALLPCLVSRSHSSFHSLQIQSQQRKQQQRLYCSHSPSSSSSSPSSCSQDTAATTTSTLLKLSIPTARDLQELGAICSMDTGPADAVLFTEGDLGAGKTTFCRGFVRARTRDWNQQVTSPTYLLDNTYVAPSLLTNMMENNENNNREASTRNNHHQEHDDDDNVVLIHHLDLYRLSGSNDAVEQHRLQSLDLEHIFKHCIALVEWPCRLGNNVVLPDERLDVSIQIQDNTGDASTDNDDDCDDLHDDTNDHGDTRDEEQDEQHSIPRLVTLKAHGEKWTKRLQHLVDEGYVDDLLL